MSVRIHSYGMIGCVLAALICNAYNRDRPTEPLAIEYAQQHELHAKAVFSKYDELADRIIELDVQAHFSGDFRTKMEAKELYFNISQMESYIKQKFGVIAKRENFMTLNERIQNNIQSRTVMSVKLVPLNRGVYTQEQTNDYAVVLSPSAEAELSSRNKTKK